nr:hypothetical protein [Lachnospiraceae bacterium]
MRNTINADIRRVLRKKSYYLLVSICLALLAIVAVIDILWKKDIFVSVSSYVCQLLFPFLLGIPVFLAVYGDDFKSRAMQTAIGFGLSRRKLILARYIEVILILIQSYVVVSLFTFLFGAITGSEMKEILKLIETYWYNAIQILCWMSLAMIIVYIMQNTTFALVIFIVLATGLVGTILQGISMVPFFVQHKIDLSVITSGRILQKAFDTHYK